MRIRENSNLDLLPASKIGVSLGPNQYSEVLVLLKRVSHDLSLQKYFCLLPDESAGVADAKVEMQIGGFNLFGWPHEANEAWLKSLDAEDIFVLMVPDGSTNNANKAKAQSGSFLSSDPYAALKSSCITMGASCAFFGPSHSDIEFFVPQGSKVGQLISSLVSKSE
jgi:hypothetical protein